MKCKTCQVTKCVHQVMHDLGMIEHAWGKVCNTHIKSLKHVKNVKTWYSPKCGTHQSPKQQQNAIWAFHQTHSVHTNH